MKKIFRRSAAAVSAAALSLCALPYAYVAETAQASESLMTRDVWCANEDVNRWESEHFQFIWGKNGADSSKITQAFLEENAKHMEACWDVYMNELSMEPPTQSVNLSLRDGNKYKVNIYLSGTGLSPFPDDWAYMGYDNQGYAFMFCCVGAMQNSPNPSWVLPHEFGHVVTAHQLGWNQNKYVQSWWESIGNWFREQFLYSDYYSQWVTNPASGTDYFETYMKNLCFTPILGRDNYASWAFLQYLTENPDNLPGYGSDFMKTMMQQGKVDEYPYLEIERLSGADLKDTLGHYAKRMATLDLNMQDRYRARQNQLLSQGEWNWGEIYTLLEKTTEADNYYTVPTERAPQQFGLNIIPLEVTGDTVSVSLDGLTSVKGADWRACIAVEQYDGETRYSELFGNGGSASIAFNSSTDSAAYLTVTATPDSDTFMEVGVPYAYYDGEFDENNYPFLSKTRYPYAVTINGAGIKQMQNNTAAAQGRRHSNGGGFVASTATVDASVYVGPNAKVMGYASVTGNAVIDGYATVTGSAKVSGNAVVTGHAVVAERATVKDNAIIGDYAGVMGNAVISENARVLESGLVYNNYTVSGNATVKGVAFCMANGSAGNQAMPDGDYYDDSSRSVSQGSMYGWASPDTYVNRRPYSDGQYAGLEFSSDSSEIAADTYTSTFGMSVGSPVWEASRTSGNGVLTFNGENQYIIADSSYAALHDADYQTAVLMRNNDLNPVFRFGNEEKYMSLVAMGGNYIFAMNDGSGVQNIIAENAYTPGKWSTVSVVLEGDEAKLVVDGKTAASGTITVDPVDVISEESVYTIGAYKDSQYMNGSMDFFRVNFKEVAEPSYYYTETEDIDENTTTEPTGQVLVGDVTLDMQIDVFDHVYLRKIVTGSASADTKQLKAAADTNGDKEIGIADVVAMQSYLLGRINEFPAGSIAEY